MLPVKSLFGFLKRIIKATVKLGKDIFPETGAFLDIVQSFLHASSKFKVNNVLKSLDHEFGHNLAQNCRTEILALLNHIFTAGDGADCRRVGTRSADTLFLHGTDKRCFSITGGRLCELLLLIRLCEINLFALAKIGQRSFPFTCLIVLGFLVNRGIARKLKLGIVGAEKIARGKSVNCYAVINGVCHLAGGKAPPNKAIKPVLVGCEVFFDKLRRQLHAAGADCFMRVLRSGFRLENSGLVGIIIPPVVLDDKVLSRFCCVLG